MKVAVVTGATSGLGNLLVKDFIKKGWKVFAGYRKKELMQELEAISPNVIPFYIDLEQKETVKAAAEFILSKTDHIYTIINAAGSVVAGPIEKIDPDNIRKQFEVNTFSNLEFVQILMPKLVHSKIINISSMASFGVFPFIAPYGASKRALDMLFNAMSMEIKNRDVHIVSIKPGVIKTPLWDKSIEQNKDVLQGDEKYKAECEFLVKNAQKNNQKGLEAQEVVDFIMEVNNMKNPRPSYTIGNDAKFAEVFASLPLPFVNFVVAKVFAKRVSGSFC